VYTSTRRSIKRRRRKRKAEQEMKALLSESLHGARRGPVVLIAHLLVLVLVFAITESAGLDHHHHHHHGGGGGGLPSSAWSVVGHDGQHTWNTPFEMPSEMGLVSSIQLSSGTFDSSPVVGLNNTIILPFPTNVLAVYDTSLQVLWQYNLGDQPGQCTVAGDDGDIFCMTPSEVVALTSDGSLLWATRISSSSSGQNLGFISPGPGE